jgi:uncharacterized protein (DUF1499 family)
MRQALMTNPALFALSFLVLLAVVAVPASAAPACTGVVVGGQLTGTCPDDPNCPSPENGGTGFYVRGVLVACTID